MQSFRTSLITYPNLNFLQLSCHHSYKYVDHIYMYKHIIYMYLCMCVCALKPPLPSIDTVNQQ